MTYPEMIELIKRFNWVSAGANTDFIEGYQQCRKDVIAYLKDPPKTKEPASYSTKQVEINWSLLIDHYCQDKKQGRVLSFTEQQIFQWLEHNLKKYTK